MDVQDYKYHRIKIPRIDTDHRMIVVGLKTDSEQQHKIYTTINQWRQLDANIMKEKRRDTIMTKLQNRIQRTDAENFHRSRSYISESTWQLLDEKKEARRVRDIVETLRLKN